MEGVSGKGFQRGLEGSQSGQQQTPKWWVRSRQEWASSRGIFSIWNGVGCGLRFLDPQLNASPFLSPALPPPSSLSNPNGRKQSAEETVLGSFYCGSPWSYLLSPFWSARSELPLMVVTAATLIWFVWPRPISFEPVQTQLETTFSHTSSSSVWDRWKAVPRRHQEETQWMQLQGSQGKKTLVPTEQ